MSIVTYLAMRLNASIGKYIELYNTVIHEMFAKKPNSVAFLMWTKTAKRFVVNFDQFDKLCLSFLSFYDDTHTLLAGFR